MPPQDKPARSDDIVLPAGNRRDVVVGRTRIEIASFASQRDESPDTNVDAGSKIEDTASELPRRLVGTAIDPSKALFIVGISAPNDRVGRNPR